MDKLIEKIHKFEIEISSYCNRQCVWCSNSIYNRFQFKEMDENLFIKIVSELQKLGFNDKRKTITFSKFNEPMFDIELLKRRVLQLRLFLPDVELSINTNGDYLIEDVFNLPINILSIMDYDNNGEKYGEDLLKKFGAKGIFKNGNKLETYINGIFVRYCSDWINNFSIEDRGNLLDNSINVKWRNNRELRCMPCSIKNRPISIDYNGYVSPCCHIREDATEHKQYIIGNVNLSSISDILLGENFKNFNKVMEGNDNAKYFFPCMYCQKVSC